MQTILPTIGTMDNEAVINQMSADLGRGNIEDKKVAEARIQAHTQRIHDKRQEHIENLKKQMRGVSGGGVCFKFLRSTFKVFDIFFKPITALSFGKLNLELGRAMDVLKQAKDNKALLGLKIKGQQAQAIIQDLKKMFADDLQSLDLTNEQSTQEADRILRIMESLHDSFAASNGV